MSRLVKQTHGSDEKMPTLHVGSSQFALVIRELDVDEQDKRVRVQEHVSS